MARRGAVRARRAAAGPRPDRRATGPTSRSPRCSGPSARRSSSATGIFEYYDDPLLGVPYWLPALWANGGFLMRRLFRDGRQSSLSSRSLAQRGSGGALVLVLLARPSRSPHTAHSPAQSERHRTCSPASARANASRAHAVRSSTSSVRRGCRAPRRRRAGRPPGRRSRARLRRAPGSACTARAAPRSRPRRRPAPLTSAAGLRHRHAGRNGWPGLGHGHVLRLHPGPDHGRRLPDGRHAGRLRSTSRPVRMVGRRHLVRLHRWFDRGRRRQILLAGGVHA